jgi:hypothetical protein
VPCTLGAPATTTTTHHTTATKAHHGHSGTHQAAGAAKSSG